MPVSVYFNNQGATREQFLVEDLESTGDEVIFQDFTTGEQITVVIDFSITTNLVNQRQFAVRLLGT